MRLVKLYLGIIYPILLLALFFLFSIVPFSIDAFTQPYYGEGAGIAIMLAALSLGYLLIYHAYLLPMFLKRPASHIVAIALPQTIAILGFYIGFINANPWAALPFFLVAFLNYVHAYLKVRELETG